MRISSILRTLLPLALAVVAGAVLFWTSRGVQQSSHELASLRDAVSYEREAIRVLQAEWSYLNNPARLDALVRKHFEMQVPNPVDMINDIDVLPQHIAPVVPMRKPPVFRHAVARPDTSVQRVSDKPSSSYSSQKPSLRSNAANSPSSVSQPDNLPASSSQNDKGFFSLIDEIANEGRNDDQ